MFSWFGHNTNTDTNNSFETDIESKEEIKQEALNNSLINAVACSNIKKVDKLLEQGADIHCCFRGNDDWICDDYQPIHIAASKGDLEMVKHLYALGADITAKAYPYGTEPETPFEIARSAFNCDGNPKHKEVADFLEIELAKINVNNARKCGHHPAGQAQQTTQGRDYTQP